jgi:hypothetical protein
VILLLLATLLFQTPDVDAQAKAAVAAGARPDFVFGRPPACGYEFADMTNSLSEGDKARITKAADELSAVGATPRVLIIGPISNIDQTESDIERACDEWQGPNHKRKTTLVALVYSPESHKFGVYSGTAFHEALGNGQWVRIAVQYGKPHFAAGETADGFVAVLDAVKRRIKESESSGVTNEATDYSGLWAALRLFLYLAVAVGVLLAIGWLWIRTDRKKRERMKAQADAINAKLEAANLLNANKSRTDLDDVWRSFRDLSNRVSTDPYEKSYTTEEYKSIQEQYERISSAVRAVTRFGINNTEEEPQPPKPISTEAREADRGKPPKSWGNTGHGTETVSAENVPTEVETYQQPTIVPVPIIIPETTDYGREEREDRREREEDERESRNQSYSTTREEREEKEDTDNSGGGSIEVGNDDNNNDDGGSVDTSDTSSSDDSSSSNDGGSIDV